MSNEEIELLKNIKVAACAYVDFDDDQNYSRYEDLVEQIRVYRQIMRRRTKDAPDQKRARRKSKPLSTPAVSGG